ncbi:type IV secretion system DNA-binding domain-containing protein [Pseudodesulfovibrio sp. S3]|uniref:type IV secretion system DNA-binding domain-containing protein n=1 Tax=unclassified Pseudodesulfovibrio TaxID=2661612 RepID=UPI000FEBDF0A|nr:type IV secretion system DNA-binding domain-containing protein [Pseudodesulfovibrio sp. S3]MCJ2163452.1 type IV secretory system conjugative DNA transfer family protein [Pseudodesulfovibrio sp. S3-i]
MLVIGGVGRGKTASFMLPMASALIDQGFPGLILDIKNNFTGQVRQLALLAGREKDIIEIGTHPTATPINLLEGLSQAETQQLIESLLLSGQEHSANIDWLYKGVRLLADMAMLLRFVCQYEQRFAPNFALLDRCVNDYDFSRRIFELFLSSVYNRDDFAQRSFVTRVQSTAFHILTEKKKQETKTYHEQLDYQLRGPRQMLAAITSDESLVANLSCCDPDITLDYRELLKAGKIVILRFKTTQGHAARLLARSLKEKFYNDVYRTLDDGSEHHGKCFFMADEYQDVINVSSNNPFDDFSWFSKAREFGCINIVATQALSSLYTNALLRDQVNALVANCSTKIVLQNDDPAADRYFRHFCGLDKTLAQLGSNEALVARFDPVFRKQLVQTLYFRKAFERCQSHFSSAVESKHAEPRHAPRIMSMSELDDILTPLTLPAEIAARPDYMELVIAFKDILCELEDLTLMYDRERHSEVMEALDSLKDRFGTKVTVKALAAIENAGVYMEIDCLPLDREKVDDFVRELLEGSNAVPNQQ